MRKLSYFVIGILILIVAIFVVTPYFIGNTTQEHLSQELATLHQQHPNITAKISNYRRRWFSSDVTATVDYQASALFPGDMTISKPMKFQLNARIDHGPIISYTLDGKKIHRLGKAAIVFTSPQMQGDIVAVADWNGSVELYFNVEKFNYQTAESSISAQNVKGYLQHNLNHKLLNYNITIGRYKIFNALSQNMHDTFDAANTHLQGQLTKQEGLWIGQVQIQRESSVMMRNNKLATAVKNLNFDFDSELKNNKANFTMKLNAADFTFARQKLGKLSYALNISQMDPQALRQLMSALQKIRRGERSFSNITAVYSPMFTLVEKGLTIDLQNLTIALPDSAPIKLAATIQFVAAPQGVNLINAVKYMSAHANLSLPREFLLQQLTEFYQDQMTKSSTKPTLSASEHAKQTLQQWLNRHMLKANGDVLEAVITIKDGELLVNGNKADFKI